VEEIRGCRVLNVTGLCRKVLGMIYVHDPQSEWMCVCVFDGSRVLLLCVVLGLWANIGTSLY
jgi:hypothetical protein